MKLNDYQCQKCNKIIESDKPIKCECGGKFVKLFGGRSADVKDYKWRDIK